MVFGSSLIITAFLLSGGQPILSDVESIVAMESEIVSLAPCPEEKDPCAKCKNKCPSSITYDDGVYKLKKCYIKGAFGYTGIICQFIHEKYPTQIDELANFCN
jgi:hypothetical protein